jgi:hypothetical protein
LFASFQPLSGSLRIRLQFAENRHSLRADCAGALSISNDVQTDGTAAGQCFPVAAKDGIGNVPGHRRLATQVRHVSKQSRL